MLLIDLLKQPNAERMLLYCIKPSSSKDAYNMAKKHKQYKDYFRQFITESEWAYCWALKFGDKEHMIQYITESEWAYKWAHNIGNKEHMKQFITESKWAFYWTYDFGDKKHMIQFVTEPTWINEWNLQFPNDIIT